MVVENFLTMPHVNSGGSSELSSQDEVRVFKTEGEEETEKRSSENLSDDKLEIVIEEDDITGKVYPNI